MLGGLLAICSIAMAAPMQLGVQPGLGIAQSGIVRAVEVDLALDSAIVEAGYIGVAINSNGETFWLVRIKTTAEYDFVGAGDFDGWAWTVPGGGIGTAAYGDGTGRIEIDGTHWRYAVNGMTLAEGTCSGRRGADEVSLMASAGQAHGYDQVTVRNTETRIEFADGQATAYTWGSRAEVYDWYTGGWPENRPQWKPGVIYAENSGSKKTHWTLRKRYTIDGVGWSACNDETTGDLWCMLARRGIYATPGCSGRAAYPVLSLQHRAPGGGWTDLGEWDTNELLEIGAPGYSGERPTVELWGLQQTAPGQLLACLSVNGVEKVTSAPGIDYRASWDTAWVSITVPGSPDPDTREWVPSGNASLTLVGGSDSIGVGAYTTGFDVDAMGIVHALVAEIVRPDGKCRHWYCTSMPGAVSLATSTVMPGKTHGAPQVYRGVMLVGSRVVVNGSLETTDGGVTWDRFSGPYAYCESLKSEPQQTMAYTGDPADVTDDAHIAVGIPRRTFDEQSLEVWRMPATGTTWALIDQQVI